MAKKTLALLYGGKSAEHEVSLRSARSIFQALDRERYEIVLLGIDKNGHWHLQSEKELLLDNLAKGRAQVSASGEEVVLTPAGNGSIFSLRDGQLKARADVIFPVLHGPLGEDGTVQGLLELAQVPYVGCGVLASAVCMDKEVAKRLLFEAKIPSARYLVLTSAAVEFKAVVETLGLPLFVKPANLGSSVGISRAVDEKSFREAVELALRYDRKVIIEEEIKGREIECSVLGNESPEASIPGEIVPSSKHGFYSYEAKYLDDDGAELHIPADLPVAVAEQVRALAVKAYQTLCCEGLARVDFFVVPGAAEWAVYVNELNTLPGFTSISMYPKLWEQTGLAYAKLLDKLVELAVSRRVTQQKLNSSAF